MRLFRSPIPGTPAVCAIPPRTLEGRGQSWQIITFNYQSMDGTRHYTSGTTSLNSTPGQPTNWTSQSVGGQGQLSVSATFNGSP